MVEPLTRNQLRKRLDDMPITITQKMVTMQQDNGLRQMIRDRDFNLEHEIDENKSVLHQIASLSSEIGQFTPRLTHQKQRVIYWQEQTYTAEDRLRDAGFQIAELESTMERWKRDYYFREKNPPKGLHQ